MSNINNKNDGKCAVCFRVKNEEIVECLGCKLKVHGKCYGSKFLSWTMHNKWKCRYCHAISSKKAENYKDPKVNAIKCRICNQYKFGALKKCEQGEKDQGFAHLVCAKWTPFICIGSEYTQAPIKGIERCQEFKAALNKLYCTICQKSHATMKCRYKECKRFYHPLCLLETNRDCMIEQQGVVDGLVTTIYYTYCPDHLKFHQV